MAISIIFLLAFVPKPYDFRSYPHKKVSRDLTGKKQGLTEMGILSKQDFIIINLENLGLTWLISVSLNEN